MSKIPLELESQELRFIISCLEQMSIEEGDFWTEKNEEILRYLQGKLEEHDKPEGKEIWVIYEEDDNLEVLMEGSLDEIKERFISLFKEGFCDFHLVPKKEYLKRKEEMGY